MANDDGPNGMLTLVCITCGNEMFFDATPPKADNKCDKCGGTVFRSFFTPTARDQAAESMLEDTTRSIAYGDSSPDTSAGDVRDLNNL